MSALPPTVTARVLQEKLRAHFGFRQLEAVRCAMEGRDVLTVSPLVALVKGQADALRAKGVAVAVVNSKLNAAERHQTEEDIVSGRVRVHHARAVRQPGTRYELGARVLGRDQVTRQGRTYREREERDRAKLQTLVGYAESRTCRWHTVLKYFGEGAELTAPKCGHCDRC